MAIHIRHNDYIEGIKYAEDEQIKISQLADDTTLFLKDEKSLQKSLQVIEHFGRSSGLKLNTEKSEAFWIGSDIDRKNKPCKIKWTKNYIKCLGVYCGPDSEGAIKQNYEEKIKKIKIMLNIWSQHNLSLKGKVAILKSIILPQILYIASSLYLPEWAIKEIDELFLNFLWSQKKHHVKKEVVINNISKGGLKMPLLAIMARGLKIQWIKRITDKRYTKRKLIEHFIHYKKQNVLTILQSKLDIAFIDVKSQFYKQLLEYWYHFYSIEPVNPKSIINCEIWNNKYLLIDHKPIMYKTWQGKGIKYIGDVTKRGIPYSKEELERKYSMNIKQMDYNSLIHCIPRSWLKAIKNTNLKVCADINTKVYVNNVEKSIMYLTCKDIYWQYVQEIGELPKSESKWNKYIDCNHLSWQDHYCIPYDICRETYVQSFQYKICNRFFPYNYALSIWYENEEATCKHCHDNEIDYLEHYFFYCKKSVLFWNSMNSCFFSITNTKIHIDVKDVLFGIPNDSKDDIMDFMNYCILYGKLYIYESKKKDTEIFFLNFVRFIKDKLLCEKTNSEIKGEGAKENFLKYYEMF